MNKVKDVSNRLIPGRSLNEINMHYTKAVYLMGWIDAICSFRIKDEFGDMISNRMFAKHMVNRVLRIHNKDFEGLLNLMPTDENTKFIKSLL